MPVSGEMGTEKPYVCDFLTQKNHDLWVFEEILLVTNSAQADRKLNTDLICEFPSGWCESGEFVGVTHYCGC